MVAPALTHAAGAPSTLLCGRKRDARRLEARRVRGTLVAHEHPVQATVNDERHIRDRHRGLRDVGRDHNLRRARRRREEGLALLARRKLRVQLVHVQPLGTRSSRSISLKPIGQTFDLGDSWHEHKHGAFGGFAAAAVVTKDKRLDELVVDAAEIHSPQRLRGVGAVCRCGCRRTLASQRLRRDTADCLDCRGAVRSILLLAGALLQVGGHHCGRGGAVGIGLGACRLRRQPRRLRLGCCLAASSERRLVRHYPLPRPFAPAVAAVARVCDRALEIVLGDREGTAWDVNHTHGRRVAAAATKIANKRCRVDGRRHEHQFDAALGALHEAAQDEQQQVCVDRALVDLVHHDVCGA
eukprot:280205-Prymnesium_polylepis.1